MGSADEVAEPIISATRTLTPEEISEMTGYSVEKVQKVLDFLIKFGFIAKNGTKYERTRQGKALAEL